jgi:hypothetical protein
MSVFPDHYILKDHSSRRFSIDSAYEILKESGPINFKHHFLWFLVFILRHLLIYPLTHFYKSSSHHGHAACFPDHSLFGIYHLWVICSDTWPLVLLVLLFYCNFGCYHKQNPFGLAFHDMVTSTIVGIHVIEKGMFASTCSISSLSHDLLHLVWEE